MILATDLDRTLLPNGYDPYDEGSMEDFFSRFDRNHNTLMYVSGRNLELLHHACDRYHIELPDYFIGEVGTIIYQLDEDKREMHHFQPWIDLISTTNPHWDRKIIEELIKEDKIITLQEGWKNNRFKVSFYLHDETRKNQTLKLINDTLEAEKIDAEVIYSYDPLQKVGLIDILPGNVSKLAAINYMREVLGQRKEEVIYCGDSGNDILPLTAGYNAIVVNNATGEFKETIKQIAQEKGISDHIYFASGVGRYNGNYVSGILEGLEHFSNRR